MKLVTAEFITTKKSCNYKLTNDFGDFKIGEMILIDEEGVIEPAIVIKITQIDKLKETDENLSSVNGKILRKLSSSDKTKLCQLKTLALEYLPLCQKKVEKHGLNAIKLIDADFSFDGRKLTFYFSAEGRVDFRELVTDLVKSYHKIIRLQQIGVRDEAKFIGGFGRCGRQVCCSTFLKNAPNVTLEMTKSQDLMSSANKLSGLCGKLMCCLSYEKEIYDELVKKLPLLNEEIKNGSKKGRVIARNILKQSVIIESEDGKRHEVPIR